MGRYFGTDGFRGRVGEGLTGEHAWRIGRFLGSAQGGRVLIGRDTRLSGEMLAHALAAGVMASGGEAHMLGVATTPAVSYLAQRYDCAVMLSASHNPYDDNGIKLFSAAGEKISDALIRELEAYLDNPSAFCIPHATGVGVGRVADVSMLLDDYEAHLVSLGICPLAGLRVGLDCANGGAYRVARHIFEALGVETVVTGDSPNGININDGVGSTHISHLAESVTREGLDMGFAFDGDADRCIAVNEKGEVVDGDGILYLAAKDMCARGDTCRGVVGTVLSNTGLEVAFARNGVPFLRTSVGDRYVWEEMKRTRYPLGGEPSGHIIFSSDALTGDGILTAVKILSAVVRAGRTLSRLTEGFVRYPHLERNVPCTDPAQLAKAPSLLRVAEEARLALAGHGRALVRASGTEPKLRLMCEAESKTVCHAWMDRMEACARALAQEQQEEM